MARRGENIRKRKDGRWEGRYKEIDPIYGTAKYSSVYGRTYREVKGKMAEARANASLPKASKNSRKTFADVLWLWMDANRMRHKGATEAKYDYLIERHILPELGAMRPSDINSTVLNEFIYRKSTNGRLDGSGGLSPSYVRSIVLIVQSALAFAVDEKICLPINIKANKPAIEKSELTVLNAGEQKALEESLMCDTDGTKLGVLISLNTGLRIGEVCALTWDDIDFNERIIHVRNTVARVKAVSGSGTELIIDKPKTQNSLRDIPISSRLYPVLEGMKKRAYSEYVISDTNTFMSPRTYEYRYHRILNQCNIRSVNYHVLRHTFATRCIEVGVDVKSLSEILGHASVSITMNTYVHSSMELKRKQMEKLFG